MITAIRSKNILKTIGPGLLFASTAIGTSHLVLSTRAGAHHGMVMMIVIVLTLLLKYPFYEFGPRYAIATGDSLVTGYRKQGRWAVWVFLGVVSINMFAVTGAIGAVSAGLLSTIIGIQISMPVLVGGVIAFTVGLLLFGGYSVLDVFIKILSIVLLVTVSIAFFAVLLKGPVEISADFVAPTLFDGAGLALMVSLIGWMPAGIEASTMNSIWVIEKKHATNYTPTLKESLFDFNLGFIFTTILAIMFLTIGAFTIYGSGQLLEGNATQFCNTLIAVFTESLGQWSYWIIAIGAFGTIYGTLITIMDAFTRSFVRAVLALQYTTRAAENDRHRLLKFYRIILPVLGLGGFSLFYFSATSMVKILEIATIIAFLTAPLIAYLNLRAITSHDIQKQFRPSAFMLNLAYVGLVSSVLFALYYIFNLLS